jgi:hypothetical protein
MKKGKKLLLVGLIGLMMATGLVLVGCGSKCPEGGDCNVFDFAITDCTDTNCYETNILSSNFGKCTC